MSILSILHFRFQPVLLVIQFTREFAVFIHIFCSFLEMELLREYIWLSNPAKLICPTGISSSVLFRLVYLKASSHMLVIYPSFDRFFKVNLFTIFSTHFNFNSLISSSRKITHICVTALLAYRYESHQFSLRSSKFMYSFKTEAYHTILSFITIVVITHQYCHD